MKVDLSPELALDMLLYTNWDTENSAHRRLSQTLSRIVYNGERVTMDVTSVTF